MSDPTVTSGDQLLVAQASETILTIDPDSGEARVTVQPGEPLQLNMFSLTDSTVTRDGGELLVSNEQGSVLRISGLSDETVTFIDGSINGSTLALIADIQPDAPARITGIDGGTGPVTILLDPDALISVSEAGLSTTDTTLSDGNNVALLADGRELVLDGLADHTVAFAEGELGGRDLVALLASRRAEGGASELAEDLSDGSAVVEVMSGVPVDLTPLNLEDLEVQEGEDGLVLTLADGSTLEIVGLTNETVVFADAIVPAQTLADIAGSAGVAAVDPVPAPGATDLPDGFVLDSETGAITVTVEPGQTVDLTDFTLADSAVVLDGEDIVITLADGRVLTIVGLNDEIVQFADASLPANQFAALVGDDNAGLLAPAAGPAAGPAVAAAAVGPAAAQQGGGTIVTAQDQGPLGDPLPLTALLNPTELGFGTIDPDPGVGDGDGLAGLDTTTGLTDDPTDPDGPDTPDGPDDPDDPDDPDNPLDPVPVAYNAEISVGDQPVAPQVGSGASAVVPIDLNDDGPGAGTTANAPPGSPTIGSELAGIDTNDGRILDGLLVVELPQFGTLLFDFEDGTGLTPITADMLLGGADQTVFAIEDSNDFIYQANGNYGAGAATWQKAIDDGIVSSITANSIGGADEFVLAEVANQAGAGNLNNTNPLGVVGKTTIQDSVDIQLGHDSRAGLGSEINVSTEALRIDFAVDISTMTFEAVRLFANEYLPTQLDVGNEIGRWTVYSVDDAGNATQLATETFTGTDPVQTNLTQGAFSVVIDPGQVFNRIEFTAEPYSGTSAAVPEPSSPQYFESTDYLISNINVLPSDGDSFQYTTFVDTDASETYDPAVDVAAAPATVYLDTEIV